MKRIKKEIELIIVNFEELYVALQKPNEKKKGISEIGREPSFNEDMTQREYKVADYVGT